MSGPFEPPLPPPPPPQQPWPVPPPGGASPPPGGGPPPWPAGPQWAGWQSPPARTTNGLAIAALVLGIVWAFWVGSLLALVFGIVALRQIKRSNGWQQGRGMAIAGVVLGAIGMAFLALVIALAATGAFSEPYSYGDDDRLDGLWDDCGAGDMGACDDLYDESPIDSEYEDFGDTCGHRRPAGSENYCEGEVEP